MLKKKELGDLIGSVDDFYDAATGGDPNAWAGENPEQIGREDRTQMYAIQLRIEKLFGQIHTRKD